MDLESSPCILPEAEKTHSTPADEAGAAKYTILLHHQFTILARLGHLGSFSFHQLSTLMLMSVLRVGEGLLQLVERQSLAFGLGRGLLLDPAAQQAIKRDLQESEATTSDFGNSSSCYR